MQSLSDKVALVTGASRGIGRAIAWELACRGAYVAVNYRSRKDLAESLQAEIEEMGGTALAIQADVGDSDEAAELVGQTVESLGRLDIVINNAGIWEGSRLEDVEPERLEALLATNLKSAFYVTGPALPIMKEAGWGRVVNISSVIGVTGYPGDTMYAATKAGLFGFTKSLARELARFGITVNAVVPGFIDTDMADDTGDETRERILKTIPMRRYGKALDVAELVAFLCESGDYITGQLFTVDGGYTI
ncbi:MAG: 3-oxoacyl-ACP reductase FabG [Actinobacteria bacterium]|nr:3-oxoacyl-ACP reductase FabG [Actinomycetota bacterium]